MVDCCERLSYLAQVRRDPKPRNARQHRGGEWGYKRSSQLQLEKAKQTEGGKKAIDDN